MSDIVTREFVSPRSKLKRARHHITDLSQALDAFAAGVSSTKRVEPVTEEDGSLYQRGKRILARRAEEAKDPLSRILAPHKLVFAHRLYIDAPPFEEINSVASDVVQNLRQALDHAACACARSLGKTDKDTFFPLIKSGGDLEAKIKDQARKLPPSVQDIIRLYEPGGGLLSELHLLGIADKHRQICEFVCFANAGLNWMRAGPSWIATGLDQDEWDPVANCLNFALSGSPDETDYDFQFTFQFRFNTGGIIATKPAVLALNELADLIGDIIRKMEAETARLLEGSGPS